MVRTGTARLTLTCQMILSNLTFADSMKIFKNQCGRKRIKNSYTLQTNELNLINLNCVKDQYKHKTKHLFKVRSDSTMQTHPYTQEDFRY